MLPIQKIVFNLKKNVKKLVPCNVQCSLILPVPALNVSFVFQQNLEKKQQLKY